MSSLKCLFIILLAFVLSSALARAEDTVPPPLAEPNEELTLAQALALTLEHNPELAAFQWDIRAAEARTLQAGLRPNPELSFEVEDLRLGNTAGGSTRTRSLSLTPGTSPGVGFERSKVSDSGSAVGESQITLSLSQLVELGGKRAKRIRFAEQEKVVADWDYEVARADALTATAQAFFAVLAAQEQVLLSKSLVDLTEQVHGITTALVKAGKVSPIQESTGLTELGTIRLAVEHAQRQLEAERIHLTAQWGNTVPRFREAAGALSEVGVPPAFEDLKARVAASPDLSRWMAELERRNAALVLERANGKPDITVALGARTVGTGSSSERAWGLSSTDGLSLSRSNDLGGNDREQSVVLGVSVPLPFSNRNQGRIREAEHLISKAAEERRSTEVRIDADVGAGWQLLQGAYAEIQGLEKEILPKAEEAFNATREGYRQGKFALLDVLVTERTLFDARRQLAEARAEYHQTKAALERFTGDPVVNANLTEIQPVTEEKP